MKPPNVNKKKRGGKIFFIKKKVQIENFKKEQLLSLKHERIKKISKGFLVGKKKSQKREMH